MTEAKALTPSERATIARARELRTKGSIVTRDFVATKHKMP